MSTDVSELLETLRSRLERGKRVRRRLPGGGRLHVDRNVPYLCTTAAAVEGNRERPVPWLVRAQASHLDPGKAEPETLAPLIAEILAILRASRGEALLCAVWESSSERELVDVPCHWTRPRFEVLVPPALDDEVARPFVTALRELEGYGRPSRVTVRRTDLPLCVPGSGRAEIGIAVAPVYRDEDGGRLPEIARIFERRFALALRLGLHGFCRSLGDPVEHPMALGRRTLAQAAWNVDRKLSAVNRAFNLIALVTPCNTPEAWRTFAESGFREEPAWRYRPLPIDVAVTKRDLFDIPIEKVEDPVLAELFREKQEELDRQLTLLRDRGTDRFLPGSLQIYGVPSEKEVERASGILDAIPPGEDRAPGERAIDAEQMAVLVREEIRRYEEQDERFEAEVVVDPEQPSGLLVSGLRISVGADTLIARRRVEPLLHHEVGTHALTFHNGTRQRLRLFASGFAGYEPLQEGIGVLAELLVGGLTVERARTLAARVLAVDARVRGAPFSRTFEQLVDGHGFRPEAAFHLVMRVYRGGGLTKDAIYLRGLDELLAYLRNGGSMMPLSVGKIALHHLPVLRELTHRNFYRTPPLTPRYLERPEVQERLARIRAGTDLLESLS